MNPKHAPKILTSEELEAAIAQFAQQVSTLFNEKLTNAQAHETKFVERESKLTGHLFLTIFTFGISIYGTPSLNDLVGLLNAVVPHLSIRRQGLHERITEKAVAFFEKMLSSAIAVQLPKRLATGMLTLCPLFKRIFLFDSTAFQLPNELAEYFRGSGGGGSDAAIKILLGYDCKSSQFFYVLEDGTAPDHLINYGFINKMAAEDLEISDLGFFNIKAFWRIDEKGAFYLSRMKANVNVYSDPQATQVIDLVKLLKKLKTNDAEIEVYLKTGKHIIKSRLIIERMPDEIKAKRLRTINQHNKKRGHQTQYRTKVLAGFNLYVTNTSSELVPRKMIRTLYGIRWQVELVFKSWKSNFALSKVTGKQPERIKCLIYAKLLFITITTKIAAVSRNYVWLTSQQEVSCFQAAKYLKTIAMTWLKAIIQQPDNVPDFIENAIRFIATNCLKGRSRKRVYPLTIINNLGA